MFALVAQDPGPAPKQDAAPASLFSSPLFLPGLLLLFFVVVIWPNIRRQKRDQAALLANVKTGAKVITSAGIVGTVIKAKDGEDEVTIRSEDARLRVLRSSIVRVVGTDDTAEVKA